MPSKFDPQKHHRHSIRIRGYDYTSPGAYFITIVTDHRECLLGEVRNGEMELNELGRIVKCAWHDLVNHYSNIELGTFVIMPNHVHGIILIKEINLPVGAGLRPAPTGTAPTQPRNAMAFQKLSEHSSRFLQGVLTNI